jgi:ABC-2 type transport system ATP-binding protein
LIRVEGFHKAYRKTVAVADLSFAVAAGEVLGLVGPNGAGKTTTLRALCGIIPPTRGWLWVAGYDIVAEPVAAKGELAYVPDEPSLFEALTVWEHLQFTASAYRVGDFNPLAQALIEQFELTEKRDTIAGELSRGMRQKTAICCALLHNPQAILFDEPLTGLDPRAIRVMKDAIVERARAGAAVIVSSHLLSLVEDLCSHLLILHRGERLYFGPLDGARAVYGDLQADATLEDVFLRATGQ